MVVLLQILRTMRVCTTTGSRRNCVHGARRKSAACAVRYLVQSRIFVKSWILDTGTRLSLVVVSLCCRYCKLFIATFDLEERWIEKSSGTSLCISIGCQGGDGRVQPCLCTELLVRGATVVSRLIQSRTLNTFLKMELKTNLAQDRDEHDYAEASETNTISDHHVDSSLPTSSSQWEDCSEPEIGPCELCTDSDRSNIPVCLETGRRQSVTCKFKGTS